VDAVARNGARGEEGQALVVSVLFIAVGAIAIVGLRDIQDRLLDAERGRRAGEAAVEAAVAVFADAFAAHAAADPLQAMTKATSDAHAAADELSHANSGPAIDDAPVVRCGAGGVEVTLSLGGHVYRAGFAGTCSPR